MKSKNPAHHIFTHAADEHITAHVFLKLLLNLCAILIQTSHLITPACPATTHALILQCLRRDHSQAGSIGPGPTWIGFKSLSDTCKWLDEINAHSIHSLISPRTSTMRHGNSCLSTTRSNSSLSAYCKSRSCLVHALPSTSLPVYRVIRPPSAALATKFENIYRSRETLQTSPSRALHYVPPHRIELQDYIDGNHWIQENITCKEVSN